MQLRSTLFALAGALALAAPAGAQDLKPNLTISGNGANGRFNGWQHMYASAQALDVELSLYNTTSADVTLTFPDPTDVADLWLTDAQGNYVGSVSLAGQATLLIPAGNSVAVGTKASWNETDWNGAQVADGIYSFQPYVNSDQTVNVDPMWFAIGIASSPGSAFAAGVQVATSGAVRPGTDVAASLHVSNLMAEAQVIGFGGPFLPEKLTFLVRDAAGHEVWHWHAMIPMIFTGPAADYFAPLDARDYGPVTWPGTDRSGNAAAAGTYTLVMKLTGTPVGHEHTATVTLAGAPAKKGVISITPASAQLNVRRSASMSGAIIGTFSAGTRVTILSEGRSWDKVTGNDATTGQMITGWVAKRYVK